MNGTIAVIMLIAAAVGGLVLLGGWVAREFRSTLAPLAVAALAVTASLWAVFQVLAGVFSPQGLAYSFGFTGPGYLVWPTAVRLTTLTLTAELVTLAVWVADYCADRGPHRTVHAWMWAHVSGPARLAWHAVIAPLMVLRDLAYRRRYSWPTRPRHRFELAAVVGALTTDVFHLIAALPTAARRVQWTKLRHVTRLHRVRTVPDVVVVEGEAVAGEVLHTWRAVDNAPAAVEEVRA